MSKRFWFLTALVCLAFFHVFAWYRIPFHVFAWYRIPVQYYLRHSQDFATPLAELAQTSLLLGCGSLLITLIASYFILLRIRKLAAILAITLTLTFWVIYSLFGQFDPLVDENFARIDLERSRAVLLAALTYRYHRYSQKIALTILAIATVFYAGATARQVSAVAPRADSETARSIFNLSAEENLLIIEMAEFQSGDFSKLPNC
jgi:drug/metabolite transporter (DMT)-like permease